MRVVVAPDAYKGTATATEVADALARGWRRRRPDDEVVVLPLADGGEGTAEVLATAHPGARSVPAHVDGPDGRRHEAAWLALPDGTAVVELAGACGLPLLAEPDPLGAATTGLGQLSAAALDGGATRLLVTLGGSASTDGGTGALAALGARFLGPDWRPLPRGGRALHALTRIDTAGLRPPPPGGVDCLVDVTAPLLGPNGAARAFGPQKGADADQVEQLEAGLAHLAAVTAAHVDRSADATSAGPIKHPTDLVTAPGSGAAGGTGFGLAALWGARLRPGACAVADAVGLPAHLADADVVVTGEGAFDATSLQGKVVGALLDAVPSRARVALVAGRLSTPPPTRVATSRSLVELAGGEAPAMHEPIRWLVRAGAELAASGWHGDGSAADPGRR
ncbi:glycerate kinase [Egicoccus halophilus]|uniref:Glycerate kinase n=1 Tax=Egicoccus halophilus TaxID=1670830 RepID=A0A8J3AA21_9ACTN|nr:glycerate kinase [Egicoccus halophilus]GGI08336.1 hypothetical protein GCM10011354_28580 [Egicoccus halophilus]